MQMTLRAWQQSNKDPKTFIVQASKQDGSDGWLTFPIGMGWQFAANYNEDNARSWQIGSHQNTLMCGVSTGTDSTRRPNGINRSSIVSNLEKVGIKNIYVSAVDYFNNLPSYKFVISPEGNGVDCHRHYEILMAGCIPIMEDNPLVVEK